MLFFLLAAYGAVMGWGFDHMHGYLNDEDPWQTLGKDFWGIGWLVIFFAVANSIIAGGNASASYVSRIIYPLGRVGVLPRALARTHPRHHTPYVALVSSLAFLYVLIVVLAIGYGTEMTLEIVGEATRSSSSSAT